MGRCKVEVGDVYFIGNIVEDFRYVVTEGEYILVEIHNKQDCILPQWDERSKSVEIVNYQTYKFKKLNKDGTYNENGQEILFGLPKYSDYKRTMKLTFK